MNEKMDAFEEGYFEAFTYVSQFGWQQAKDFLEGEEKNLDIHNARFYFGWCKYLLDSSSEKQHTNVFVVIH